MRHLLVEPTSSKTMCGKPVTDSLEVTDDVADALDTPDNFCNKCVKRAREMSDDMVEELMKDWI